MTGVTEQSLPALGPHFPWAVTGEEASSTYAAQASSVATVGGRLFTVKKKVAQPHKTVTVSPRPSWVRYFHCPLGSAPHFDGLSCISDAVYVLVRLKRMLWVIRGCDFIFCYKCGKAVIPWTEEPWYLMCGWCFARPFQSPCGSLMGKGSLCPWTCSF